MADAFPSLDYNAYLHSFLLRAYLSGLNDRKRTVEEQTEARMNLESFVLGFGPPMLRQLQKAFNLNDLALLENGGLVQWFVAFASALAEQWLREVDLSNLERFWRTFHDVRLRRQIVELMMRIELAENNWERAHLSRVINLFRNAQPKPFAAPLNTDAQIVVETLFARAKLTLKMVSTRGTLGNYSLLVLRYCFVDPGEKITGAQVDALLQYAGDLSMTRRDQFTNVLHVAG